MGQFLMSVDGGGGGGGAGEALVLITRSRAPGLALLSTNTLTLPHLHSPLIIFLPPTPGHSGSYSDFRMTTRKEADSGWTVDRFPESENSLFVLGRAWHEIGFIRWSRTAEQKG